jgi:metallophosphoesterase superfamily enzyme
VKVFDRVQTWFENNKQAHQEAIFDLSMGHHRAGEVRRRLAQKHAFPFSRDELEIWRRASMRTRKQPAHEDSAFEARLSKERETAQRKADIAELKRLLSAESKKREYVAAIAAHAPLLDPAPKLFKPSVPETKPEHTWVLVLSDWHVGQETMRESTGQMFEQSLDLTKFQVEQLWKKVERLFYVQRHSTKIRKLVILVLGDIVEGDGMRRSQTRKINEVVTKQTVDATDLLAYLVRNFLTLFEEIELHVVGGNHDRTTEKAGDAGLGELDYCDTYAWLIGAFLERLFAADSGRVRIVTHESFYGTTIVAGKRLVFEHGASIRGGSGSYGGVPWYPIVNGAMRYGQMLGGLDFFIMGHWHIPGLLPLGNGWGHLILNGALPASTHFVQSMFKSVGRPSQTLLNLHPEHGLVNYQQIYLEGPSLTRPGEYWQRHEGA